MPTAPSRYDSIAQLWSTVTVPPITRREAERVAERIFRHFGAVKLGGPDMVHPARFRGHARRCWISPRRSGGSEKGWQRLVHDVSHDLFAHRHPDFRPHAGGHATLELEIAEFVVRSGWLSGTLKPRQPAKPTALERRAIKIARTEAAIARWEAKRRRADKALQKFRRRYRALIRSSPSDPQHLAPQSSANASPSSARAPSTQEECP